MRRIVPPLAWIGLLAAGIAVAVWFHPVAFPLAPTTWKLSRGEAERLALAHLGDLGELPAERYVVTRMDDDPTAELRLLAELAAGRIDLEAARSNRLADEVLLWEVTVYPPEARPGEWTHQARVAFDGTLTSLRRGFRKDAPGQPIAEEEARSRAIGFLREQGFDLSRFEEPELRRQELQERTDLTFRFVEKERRLGARLPYGVAVGFAGSELAGYWSFKDDPDWRELVARTRSLTLVGNFSFITTFLLLPVLGVPFLRRYHAGEIGVRRGLQIGGVVLACGIVLTLAMASAQTEGQYWGNLSRRQVSWVWPLQFVAIFFLPLALLAFFGWSTGESFCRERWSGKLASFDALFQRDWKSRTFALSALRGTALGAGLAGAILAVLAVIPRVGGTPLWSAHLGPFWHQSAFPGVTLVLFVAIFTLYAELVGRLFCVEPLVRRFGKPLGALGAALFGLMLFSLPTVILPLWQSLPIWFGCALVSVLAFLRYDLLTSLLTTAGPGIVLSALPLALADGRAVQLQGTIALVCYLFPAALSLRYVTSEREIRYLYEDIPPHVRRIAERERLRVELETARRIQSSILPQLPAQLNGVELAYTYLPATEVGGDFYDVLALEDGRLAVAVGDVAGHGVSSGLVMSMAKSALAVQVSFDPGVEAVFATLNRTVFQSAEKRLLATLCYALIDPRRLEIEFASAGHLFPYRVTNDGRVESLESVAYPLGVRATIEVRPRVAKLEPGDVVFLCSDGLVEARRSGSDELMGFERVESTLRRVAGNGASVIRDALLQELREFTGDSPREDDLTLLVLRLPA